MVSSSRGPCWSSPSTAASISTTVFGVGVKKEKHCQQVLDKGESLLQLNGRFKTKQKGVTGKWEQTKTLFYLTREV